MEIYQLKKEKNNLEETLSKILADEINAFENLTGVKIIGVHVSVTNLSEIFGSNHVSLDTQVFLDF